MILGDYNQAVPNAAGQNLSVQARRPIQNFGFIQEAFGGGFLNYHAFQVKLEKRYSAGLYLLNSFTWSKAIDNASGHLETANGDNSRVNIRDLRNEKGLSGYDQPFNNTTSFTYELPFGRTPQVRSELASGARWRWRADGVLTGINTMTSGLPVNLTYSSVQSASGEQRAELSAEHHRRSADAGRPARSWQLPESRIRLSVRRIPPDPSAMPDGTSCALRVLFQLDLGLHKDFRVTEGSRLEFRTEAFNILNKTNFMAPDSNRSNNSFGTITSTFPWREIQMALRFVF